MSDYLANIDPKMLPTVLRELMRSVAALQQRGVEIDSLDELSDDLGEQRAGKLTSALDGDFENDDFNGWAIMLDPVEIDGETYSAVGKNGGSIISALSHQTGLIKTELETAGSIGDLGGKTIPFPPGTPTMGCLNNPGAPETGPFTLTSGVSELNNSSTTSVIIDYACGVREGSAENPTQVDIVCQPEWFDTSWHPDSSSNVLAVQAVDSFGNILATASTSVVSWDGTNAHIRAEFGPLTGQNIAGFKISIPDLTIIDGYNVYRVPVGIEHYDETNQNVDPNTYLTSYGTNHELPAMGNPPNDTLIGWQMTISRTPVNILNINTNLSLSAFIPYIANYGYEFKIQWANDADHTVFKVATYMTSTNGYPVDSDVKSHYASEYPELMNDFPSFEFPTADPITVHNRFDNGYTDGEHINTYGIVVSYDYAVFCSQAASRKVELESITVSNVC